MECLFVLINNVKFFFYPLLGLVGVNGIFVFVNKNKFLACLFIACCETNCYNMLYAVYITVFLYLLFEWLSNLIIKEHICPFITLEIELFVIKLFNGLNFHEM